MICKKCGNDFEIKINSRGGRPRVYCYAETCDRSKARLKHEPKYDRDCVACNTRFKARGSRGKHCESCISQQWRIRRFSLRGLTLESYQALLAEQQGRCAICRIDKPGSRIDNWCVDHDHRTGQTRGLLCTNCNQGIGKFKDDPNNLKRAAEYLEKK